MPATGIAGGSSLRANAAPEFLLDLDEAVALRDGDGIMLDDGGIVLVTGQAEPLLEIAARTPLEFVRLAWHLGNRHTDVQIAGNRLRIRRDHVLEEMVAGLGASATAIDALVRSRGGRAAARPRSWHDHGHDHGPMRHKPPRRCTG